MNDICNFVMGYLRGRGYKFERLNIEENFRTIDFIKSKISNLNQKVGPHRIGEWEVGWGENLKERTLIPKYFGKYPVIRLNGSLVKEATNKPGFEYESLCGVQEWLFSNYLCDVDHIYEFGCGTGHNLIRMHHVNPSAIITGLDWTNASVEGIKNLYPQFYGFRAQKFDMFNPDYSFKLQSDSAVCTIAAMEQLGKNFVPFLNYLLEQRPKIICHIEPFQDLLDSFNFLDLLSLQYMCKRGYIEGFIAHLNSIDDVEFIRFDRSYTGSLLLDGYSILVWRLS